jgi:hypothetical protein
VDFYRGGSNLTPKPREVRIDPATGLVLPVRGVSVFDKPDNLEPFGGAYRLDNLPPTLRIIQVGRDPHHHEIVAAQPMTMAEYERELGKITLTAICLLP